jgi:5-oxoprolinase (ATP-hydrolysing)/N-methylhydantoinase A
MPPTRIAIDIGGTFTDFVVEDIAHRATFKLLTTPQAPARAVLEGIDRIIGPMGIAPDAITTVIHGTTLATNAIIERHGAKVGFVTTAGFRDTLEMASEHRYDQYDLLIDRTPPLVPRSLRFPVGERIAADGAVLMPLDQDALEHIAVALRNASVEAVAIGFLHAYRNDAHETRAAEILRRHLPGVPVSLSSEISPEIREYERFSTVVANAYIQPLMADYLIALRAGLGARGVFAPLLLIQSNGGLCDVDAAIRAPVRLLESGPAGGAIFAAAIARDLGLDRALLLDVGGTTAKLCFIDDHRPHRTRGMEVGRVDRFRAGSGLPLRLPVVEMCEIGAGGGSIARIDTLGRLLVGPRSAGSVPGPACYARGGTQATVTDANLLLGRLDPERFADGSIPLDTAAADGAISAHVAFPLGLAANDAASALLAIVNENMANAAREHAIDADRALAGRVLIGIGGGAALHAADLARAIGIDTIVIPRDAGVGSAIGFLRAPLAFERSLSWPETLAAMDVAATRAVVERLIGQTVADVLAANPAEAADITTSLTAQMRYRGQGSELAVAVDPADLAAEDAVARLERAFAASYRALYRRVLSGPVELLAWSARSEIPFRYADPPHKPRQSRGSGMLTRNEIAPDSVIPGPAVIADTGTTIVVPVGWSATAAQAGHMILRVTHPAQVGAPDLLARQIMWARLIAVVEEQAKTLMKTAFSATVREAGDLSAAVFDRRGRMVAQARTGTPGHVNCTAIAARHFLAVCHPETMAPGDHWITNDPWLVSGHLHDITVFSPVFRAGRLIAFFACTCHQVDIGGLGMGPDARSVHEEGLYLPIMPLARGGVVDAHLMRLIRANVRTPDEIEGDILSYITANDFSAGRLNRMLDEFSLDDIETLSDTIIAASEAGTRAAIAKLPRGTWRNEMRIDGYDSPVDLVATLVIEGNEILVDLAGTSPASSRGINLVLNYTQAYVGYGARAALAPEIPNNHGSLAPVRVIAPEGCILNAPPPAPVAARHIIGQFLPELVLGCFANLLPDLIPAEGSSCNWGLQLRGATPRPFNILFFNAGGAGARPSRDGLSATAFPSGIRSIPVEICEVAAPIVIHRKELRPDSGGAGRWRGGLGQSVEVGTRDGGAFELFAVFDRVDHPARGREGGGDGARGRVALDNGEALRPKGLQTIPAGRRVCVDLPGGGGFGPPETREPERIARDREQGYVSADDAEGR